MSEQSAETIQQRLAEPMAYQWRVKTFYPKGKAGSLEPGTKGQFLAYIDARDVQSRLDAALGAGNWQDSMEIVDPARHVIKAGLGLKLDDEWVWKYDYGYPNSEQDDEPLKSAASDALKRVGVHWGIGRFLYNMEAVWVQVDKWGKPLKPITADQPSKEVETRTVDETTGEYLDEPAPRKTTTTRPAAATSSPACPVCGGEMWDNRVGKKNPKAPDFKCKDRTCDGVVWPPKPGDTTGRQREDDDQQAMSVEEEVEQYFGGAQEVDDGMDSLLESETQ